MFGEWEDIAPKSDPDPFALHEFEPLPSIHTMKPPCWCGGYKYDSVHI